MNTNIIRIVCLLDRSGSMQAVRGQSITAFNEFTNKLKASPDGACTLKLIQFDDKYEVNYDLPLQKVPALTTETFVPRGSTAYLDALGRSITELGIELVNTPIVHRPGKVIFVTITDGEENASIVFKHEQVAEMVKHQQDRYSWDFVFLGAELRAVAMAQTLNIPQSKVMYYDKSFTNSAFASMGNYVNAVRGASVRGQSTGGIGFDEQARSAATGTTADTVTTP